MDYAVPMIFITLHALLLFCIKKIRNCNMTWIKTAIISMQWTEISIRKWKLKRIMCTINESNIKLKHHIRNVKLLWIIFSSTQIDPLATRYVPRPTFTLSPTGDRLRNDMDCVGWSIKLYSNSNPSDLKTFDFWPHFNRSTMSWNFRDDISNGWRVNALTNT